MYFLPAAAQLSISASANGTLQAVYIRLRRSKIARTKEVVEDVVMADYDVRGQLVGIEILAPVKLRIIRRLVDEPRRRPFSRFVKEQAPADLVLA